MKDYGKWEINNTLKESLNFAGGIAAGMGNFAKDFAIGTVNSTADMIGAIMGDWDASERIGKGFVDAVTSIPKLPQMFGNAMDNFQTASIYDKGKTLGYSSMALTSALFPFTKGIGKSGIGDIYKAGNKVDDVAGVNALSKSGNLNSLRSKAVKQAWKQEVDLVKRTGQGTRAWTRAEIKELLGTGKVKGYFGHHINSVKGSPQLAGNPNNIRFIKGVQNHLIEHGGNFQNVTYGDLLDRFLE